MKRVMIVAVMAWSAFCLEKTARAQSIIHEPDLHHHIEIEVHGVFDYIHGPGLGAGARLGIPILPHVPIPRLNSSIYINFGADFLWWPNFGPGGCTAYNDAGQCIQNSNVGSSVSIIAYATGQWNFYVLSRISLFAEIGFAPEFNFCNGGCQWFYFWGEVAIGGRIHFAARNGYPTLTWRIGFPGLSVGVSF